MYPKNQSTSQTNPQSTALGEQKDAKQLDSRILPPFPNKDRYYKYKILNAKFLDDLLGALGVSLESFCGYLKNFNNDNPHDNLKKFFADYDRLDLGKDYNPGGNLYDFRPVLCLPIKKSNPIYPIHYLTQLRLSAIVESKADQANNLGAAAKYLIDIRGFDYLEDEEDPYQQNRPAPLTYGT